MKTTLNRFLLRLGAIALLACGCLAPAASAAEKRIAIVYSETSAARYWDEFGFSQLFMAMQNQCAMAGVPYDLLTENDLTDPVKLARYSVLVAPAFYYVPAAKRTQILAALNTATANGLSIVASGWFMALDENGATHGDFIQVMDSIIGVNGSATYSGVAIDVLAATTTHPALPGYTAAQVIRKYPKMWTNSFAPGTGADPGATATLCNFKIGTKTDRAIVAVTTRAGRRNVHFANEQIMQDSNVLWSALQWSLYGSDTSIALRLGRQRSLFFARCDMDQSKYIDEVSTVETKLLPILTDWKTKYGFVGANYINVGNNPAAGEETNWAVSGPLYQKYRALGNEIGTHSYTHPEDTKLLTAAQLEFEFNQSVQVIQANLGGVVPGAAVPGMPENMFVVNTVAPWLRYLSGRAAIADNNVGYSSAFGRIKPGYGMGYFCLNTSPDFTLIGFQKKTAVQAAAIWKTEYASQVQNAALPVIHWLWHDYGPVQAEAGYKKAMYDAMISTAYAGSAEFVTGEDLLGRVDAQRDASLNVTKLDANTQTVAVTSANAGKLALVLPEGKTVAAVDNWYAYDGNKVFLPRNGGAFTVRTGTAATVSRITKLPQRMELVNLWGNRVAMTFTVAGEGDLQLALNETGGTLQVTGADSVVKIGSTATLRFNGSKERTVKVAPVLYKAPVATAATVGTTKGMPVAIALSASAPGNPVLQYTFSSPASGVLTGTAPNLTYTPNAGFYGADSFTFQASDGLGTSAAAKVTINVANRQITVDGSLADWAGVTPAATDAADTVGTIDIKNLYAWVDAGKIYLGIDNNGPVTQLNYGYTWYLDTDQNATTGFKTFGLGADYLIEGSNVYRFAGSSPTAWSWTLIGQATSAVLSNTAELAFDTTVIGGATSFDAVFYGNNAAFGQTTADRVPQNGFIRFGDGRGGLYTPIVVDGTFTDWPAAQTAVLVDGNDVAGTNPLDITQVQMTTQSGLLYAGYTNETNFPATLGWACTLYLDTDTNPATGFRNGSLGAEFIVQGSVLFKYSGTGSDWAWTPVTSLLVSVNGPRAEFEIPRNSIGSPASFDFDLVADNAALGNSSGIDYVRGRYQGNP